MTDSRDGATVESALDAELRAVWQSEKTEAPSGREVLMDVKRRARKHNHRVLRRDLIETAAALLAWAVFAIIAFGAPGIIPKLALAVGTVFIILPVRKLHKERRRHGDIAPDAPIAQHLQLELERVEGQIELLEHVASWYVRPLAIGATIIMAGVATAVPAPESTTWRFLIVLASVVFSAAIFTGVGFLVVMLNRYAVSKNLAPLRDDLRAATQGTRAA